MPVRGCAQGPWRGEMAEMQRSRDIKVESSHVSSLLVFILLSNINEGEELNMNGL